MHFLSLNFVRYIITPGKSYSTQKKICNGLALLNHTPWKHEFPHGGRLQSGHSHAASHFELGSCKSAEGFALSAMRSRQSVHLSLPVAG